MGIATSSEYWRDAELGLAGLAAADLTTRNGVLVVAIRDPHGAEYFSPVATFQKNFGGEVVVQKRPGK